MSWRLIFFYGWQLCCWRPRWKVIGRNGGLMMGFLVRAIGVSSIPLGRCAHVAGIKALSTSIRDNWCVTWASMKPPHSRWTSDLSREASTTLDKPWSLEWIQNEQRICLSTLRVDLWLIGKGFTSQRFIFFYWCPLPPEWDWRTNDLHVVYY